MIKGIDLSVYNSLTEPLTMNLQWANGLYFAFIKASEGITVQDAKFETNWAMCQKAGLVSGAYHFLRPLTDPAQQAQNFLKQYKKVHAPGNLPPVVDIEWALDKDKKDQWATLEPAARIALIKTFLTEVEAELKIKPLIYTADSFWRSLIITQPNDADSAFFLQFPLWIVDLNKSGKLPPPWKNALFVQDYFGQQTADPNDMYPRLDHDHFNGTLLQLLNLLSPGYTISKGFPRSTLVKDLQAALTGKHAFSSAIDGSFGPLTETAVRDFQTSIGLPSTGIIDAGTWNKLCS